jgi:hypothetical protein
VEGKWEKERRGWTREARRRLMHKRDAGIERNHSHLAHHHLHQILAALYKCINVSKDAPLVQHPTLRGELVVHAADVVVRFLPEGAALNALLQSSSAPLHKAVEDVFQGYLGTAPLDDVTANLRAKMHASKHSK